MPTTTTSTPEWGVLPSGQLDTDTIDRIDDLAPQLVIAVHSGSPDGVDRITEGMDRVHLAALALSVATLVEMPDDPAVWANKLTAEKPPPGWTIEQIRIAHERYVDGDTRRRNRQGEVIWQRMTNAHNTRRRRRAPAETHERLRSVG